MTGEALPPLPHLTARHCFSATLAELSTGDRTKMQRFFETFLIICFFLLQKYMLHVIAIIHSVYRSTCTYSFNNITLMHIKHKAGRISTTEY